MNLSKTHIQKFWDRIDKSNQDVCWEWKSHKNSDGYGSMKIFGQEQKAHRISWTLHYGDIPDGMCVCHTCDNPGCVNPHHLWLGTHTENMVDKSRKGRVDGERNPNSKIDDETAKRIVREYENGIFSQAEIARKEKLSTGQVCKIIHGKSRNQKR